MPPLSQVPHVETSLRGLATQIPELPVNETLVLRVAAILGRDLTTLLERRLKPAGLSEAEFRVMMALFSHGGSAATGEICAALAQSPANLTRIGDALVERHLVVRNLHPDDRRKVMLRLEPAGEQLLRSLMPGIGAHVSRIFAGFSPRETERLLADLKRLLAGIEAAAPPDCPAREEVA